MRIYDCFTFYNELDLLEIRLEELGKTVDTFVIVQATVTCQGKDKPLYFDDNRRRFAKYADRVWFGRRRARSQAMSEPV